MSARVLDLDRAPGGSIERLANLLQQSLADEAWLAAACQMAGDYVRTLHGADTVCAACEQLATALP